MTIRFPSKNSDDPKRRAIAKWVDEQRRTYKNGTLSQERIKKLEWIPGWSWDLACDVPGEAAKE